MRGIVFLLCVSVLYANDSFITSLEYGKMLYENPRGVGCMECHGRYGEGERIAKYTHKKQAKIIEAPRINNVEFKSFKIALQEGKRVMPKYYLTADEIAAMYEYLQAVKKEQE